MSDDWKPRLAPTTNLLALTLTNVEGFLVSHIDGNTSPEDLGRLTGQSPGQVSALLARLVNEGAVLAPPAPLRATRATPLAEPDPYEAAPLPGMNGYRGPNEESAKNARILSLVSRNRELSVRTNVHSRVDASSLSVNITSSSFSRESS